MGGIGSIYYTARAKYAADHGIPFEPFSTFLMALDQEFVSWCNEKAKPDDTTPPETE